MRLIANWAFDYDGKSLKAEQEFEAADAYGEVLLMAKAARHVPTKRKYQRRDMQAENTGAMSVDET